MYTLTCKDVISQFLYIFCDCNMPWRAKYVLQYIHPPHILTFERTRLWLGGMDWCKEIHVAGRWLGDGLSN